MMLHSHCEHERTGIACEECAFIRAHEAGKVDGEVYRKVAAKPKPVLAKEDTLVPDPLVPNRFTLIKAGDPLPPVDDGPPRDAAEPVSSRRGRRAARSPVPAE